MEKTYLGDGLYAKFDGHQFELTAENGIDVSNRVFLDDSVLVSFFRYVEKAHKVKIDVVPLGENDT